MNDDMYTIYSHKWEQDSASPVESLIWKLILDDGGGSVML